MMMAALAAVKYFQLETLMANLARCCGKIRVLCAEARRPDSTLAPCTCRTELTSTSAKYDEDLRRHGHPDIALTSPRIGTDVRLLPKNSLSKSKLDVKETSWQSSVWTTSASW